MYVIGIDFGHGETSAAVIEVNDELYEEITSFGINVQDNIPKSNEEDEKSTDNGENTVDEQIEPLVKEWNAEKIKNLLLKSFFSLKDLKIKGDAKFIKSILCFDWKNNKWIVGPTDGKLRQCISDLEIEKDEYPKFAAYFKGPLIDGMGEQKGSNNLKAITESQKESFGNFVKSVYESIIESNSIIHKEPKNFRLYVACPSEWDSNQVVKYKEFLLNNGVPCEEVIEESRAAYMSFRNTILGNSMDAENSQGVLVIDFGSSTIDMTYYGGEKPVNHGYQHGAHKVEEKLFRYMINNENSASKTYDKLTSAVFNDKNLARTLLIYALRANKEKFYKNLAEFDGEKLESVSVKTFLMKIKGSEVSMGSQDIFGFGFDGYDEGYDEKKLEIILDDYLREIESDMRDFKDRKGVGEVKYVILTGGASAMPFVRRLAEEVYEVKKYSNDEIEKGMKDTLLTDDEATFSISRGISKYGTYRTLSEPIREAIENRLNSTWRDLNWVKEELDGLISQVVYEVYYDYFCGIVNKWKKEDSDIKSDGDKNLNDILELIYNEILSNNPNNYTWQCIRDARPLFKPGQRSIHALLRVLYDAIELNDDSNSDEINKLMQERFNEKVNELVGSLFAKYISLYFENWDEEAFSTKLPEFYDIKIVFEKEQKKKLLIDLIERVCSKIKGTLTRSFTMNTLNCDRNSFFGRNLSRDDLSAPLKEVMGDFCHAIKPKFDIKSISVLCKKCVDSKFNDIKYKCELEPYNFIIC